jgi:hypothetical protein
MKRKFTLEFNFNIVMLSTSNTVVMGVCSSELVKRTPKGGLWRSGYEEQTSSFSSSPLPVVHYMSTKSKALLLSTPKNKTLTLRVDTRDYLLMISADQSFKYTKMTLLR